MPNPKLIVDMIESRRQQHDASVIPDQTISEQPRVATTLNELCHFSIAAPVERGKLLTDEERGWLESLSNLLRDRLRVHMDRGLSCTQNLGPF
ncbi:hypothetical protein K435DRAFT_520431 [Dendrothele bispora CBS 962.96]|uniref:Uncharacterized protein n=1 Tax=Dendrothele bispora (strain CBS 962.96) TaxID=1314807 RepID=A0A4S8M8Y3_DENBC|nr:hypothetical protein K435DRAFT_520431 [Dendrothele bispora CBS 962.96]